MSLEATTKQTSPGSSRLKVLHQRPALIQELEWRPREMNDSSTPESVQSVVFTFYENQLFQIMATYERRETEGLTTADVIEAISANYGTAEKPRDADTSVEGPYGDREETLARWQDAQFRFDLIRSSYGPVFRLRGVLKKLEAPARTAALDAKRLDEKEAPQREAVRLASEAQEERTKLDKARVLNKPNFRP
jgi:hypothetical protein